VGCEALERGENAAIVEVRKEGLASMLTLCSRQRQLPFSGQNHLPHLV
jgi:hypothetical protein